MKKILTTGKSQSGLLVVLLGILLILDLIAIVWLLMSAFNQTSVSDANNNINIIPNSNSMINATEFCRGRCGNYPVIGIDCGVCGGAIDLGGYTSGGSSGYECDNNNDCDFPDEVCRSGSCKSCTSDSQCGNGYYCEGGTCKLEGDECDVNSDCNFPNEVCYNGNCQGCTDNNQCGNGYSCSASGVCVNSTSIVCSVNSDCGAQTSRLKCLISSLPTGNISTVINQTTNPICNSNVCSSQTNITPVRICNSNEACVESGNSASCVLVNVTCLNDLGCGTNGFVGTNPVCQNGDVYQNYISFSCNLPGTSSSSCSNSTSLTLKQHCASGCSNGVCLGQPIVCYSDLGCDDWNTRTQDVCVFPGTINSSCRHINIACMNDGECNDNEAHTLDRCILPGLGTSYCMHDRISCFNNAECDDNNLFTQDVCILPGTVNSSCQRTAIRCLANSDCGTNGFVGNPVCQSGNSYQNYTTYTCNNGGTIQSSCSSSTVLTLKQTCVNGCTNGNCNGLTCTDSDGISNPFGNFGLNLTVKGTAVGVNERDGIFGNYTDFCGNSDQVIEYLCTNASGNVRLGGYSCSISFGSNFTCQDGACVPKPTCTNTCNFAGERNCMMLNSFRVCGDYNNDGCLEWGTEQTCPTNQICDQLGSKTCIPTPAQTCTDTDSPFGFNYNDIFTKGIAEGYPKYGWFGNYTDYCYVSPIDGINYLREYSCTNASGNVAFVDVDCQNLGPYYDSGYTCVNGACYKPTVNCTTSSQCGNDSWNGDKVCQNGNVYQNYLTYNCNNAGTANSFCSNSVGLRLNQTCDYGCTNGACNPTPTINCTIDSQCGTDGYIPGTETCNAGNVFQNYRTYTCNLPGTVNSYCSNAVDNRLKQTCTYGCTAGVCNAAPSLNCVDSDGSPVSNVPFGINYFIQGTATGRLNGILGNYTDRCYDANYVYEYYCTNSSGVVSAGYYNCKNYGSDYYCNSALGVCARQVTPTNEAYLIINVTYVSNDGNQADMTDRVYVGSSLTPYGTRNVRIPLTQNRQPIIDSVGSYDVPGIKIVRGQDNVGAYYDIVLWSHNAEGNHELIRFDTEVDGAYVASINNGIPGLNEPFEFAYNGVCDFVTGDDEITILSSYPHNPWKARYCSGTTPSSDSTRQYYILNS